jgi:hypothetical protein
VIETGVSNTSYEASVFNPALFGTLAWDLGNGFGVSYSLGAYFDVPQPGAFSSNNLNQRVALSYTADGWNLTANVIYGIQLDSVTNRPQISPCPAPFGFNGCNPDFLNVDLTATKKFGKWEFGGVAYGSADLTSPIASYQKQTQFAVGGLFGYDFGPLALQVYATTDVVEHNYGGRDTRGWFRMTIPAGGCVADATDHQGRAELVLVDPAQLPLKHILASHWRTRSSQARQGMRWFPRGAVVFVGRRRELRRGMVG